MKVGWRQEYRSHKIDLNGSMEQFQQRLLLLSMPLWFVMVPGFALSISPQFSFLALSITTYCLYLLLNLRSNQIIFEKNSLLLPGVFRRRCQYSEIEYMLMEKQAILSLKLENKSQRYKIRLGGLTKEAAGELWTIIGQRLRHVDIQSAVREELMYRARNSAKEIDQSQASQSSDDMEIVILLSHHQRLAKLVSYVAKYDVIFDSGFFQAWTVFWIGFAVTVLSVFSAEKLPFLNMIVVAFMNAAGSIISTIWDTISRVEVFKTVGIFGFVLTILLSFLYMLLKWREPDSIVVNKRGITPLLHVPVGSVEQVPITWSDVAAVRLRSYKSDVHNHNAVLEIVPRTDRLPLEIPLRAFASGRLRSQFQEALQSWGAAAEISPKVLEILTPAQDDSYTELWLSSLQSAPQLSQLTPLAAGDRLEHHALVIERQLASGGQGVTYLAQISTSGETVVLKEMVLPIYIESARKRISERFERDAKLLKSLAHDQIVKLHDYFIEGHRAFLMLEYIEGQTLREKILLDGPMGESDVVDYARQMLAILDYLHSRTPAVVHRDFTPDNLLLNASQQIKLLDFDVALETDGSLISKATIVGKQNFLPPEQFRGRPCPQSDFYAMGASLYFMLTGTEPAALQSSRPKTVLAHVSSELDRFINQCTEPELKDRFATTAEMCKSLSAIGVQS